MNHAGIMPATNLRASLGKARVAIWTKHHRAKKIKGHNEFTDAQRARGHIESRVARNHGWKSTPLGNAEAF